MNHHSRHEVARVERGIEFIVDIVRSGSYEYGFPTKEFRIEPVGNNVDKTHGRVGFGEKINEHSSIRVGKRIFFEEYFALGNIHAGNILRSLIEGNRERQNGNVLSEDIEKEGVSRIGGMGNSKGNFGGSGGQMVPMGIDETNAFHFLLPIENGNNLFRLFVVFRSYENTRIFLQQRG